MKAIASILALATASLLTACVSENPKIQVVDPSDPLFTSSITADENYPEVFHCKNMDDPDFHMFAYKDSYSFEMELNKKAKYAKYVVTRQGEIRKVLSSFELARLQEEYGISDTFADDPISQQGNQIESLCHTK